MAGAFGRSELQQDVPRAIEPTLILSFDNALEQQLRAGDGIRTHDNNVGNVVLCQLSYTRSAVSVSLVGSTRLKLLKSNCRSPLETTANNSVTKTDYMMLNSACKGNCDQ